MEQMKNKKWDGSYPVRCEILDVTGRKIGSMELATPEPSKPHVGKRGTAEKVDDWTVKITLDDGGEIYGHECWWKPISDEGEDL